MQHLAPDALIIEVTGDELAGMIRERVDQIQQLSSRREEIRDDTPSALGMRLSPKELQSYSDTAKQFVVLERMQNEHQCYWMLNLANILARAPMKIFKMTLNDLSMLGLLVPPHEPLSSRFPV